MTSSGNEEKPEYKPKAHLVLEGSNTEEWGVVKDCHGNVNYVPEDAELVGTWNKYSNGVIWVSLETSLQALQNKATLLMAEMAKAREVQPRVRLKVAPVATRKLDDLRSRLLSFKE